MPLSISTFASDMNFPVGMALLPDGSLLVGTSKPTGGSYFVSTGELVLIQDVDNDGVADGDPLVVATDLPGMVTAVTVSNDLVFVTSAESGHERISVLRGGSDWQGPFPLLGQIVFTLQGFEHGTYGLASRPSPDDPSMSQLFFNIGAYGNDAGGGTVALGGLLSGRVPDSSIYMTEIHDDGSTITLSDPVQIASGLRNAMGFGFEPRTGDLWIADNGIDGLEDATIALSADELNLIPADQIGGAVENFGFPDTYTIYATGEIVGTTGIQPVVAFGPTAGMNNEGASSLAFMPTSFPDGWNNGVVVGFHGQYDLTNSANDENALLYTDIDSDEVKVVVPSGSTGVGHLDSAVASKDAVYVADMCANGSLGGMSPCGVIYRITGA